MELSKFKVEESTELMLVDTINTDIFNDIVERIIRCMNLLGINLEDKSIYYQRYSNKTSILAVKVSKGGDDDIANFMFNGCDANYFGQCSCCDVYLHAEAKSGQQSMKIANMISSDIVDFFNLIEGELAINGLSENEFFIKIPLGREVVKENKTENKALKFIRNIFKK